MVDPLFFKDNSRKSVAEKTEEEIAALNAIANKPLKELLAGNDNLLVYSSSFDDKIEKQTVFDLFSDNNLCTNNLVGFIGVNGVKLNIGSRFSEENGKQYFIKYMLQKIHKLNLFDFKTSYDQTNIWEELLYFIFPIFLKKAYHQGIFKVYQKRLYNDSNLKGKIEISAHLKQNLPFLGNIAYSNRELSMNNPVMQLIRHTIEYISSKGYTAIFNNDFTLNTAVQTIKSVTPDYDIRDRFDLIIKNFKKVNHPFFTEYEPLRKICIQILNNDGLSFNNHKNKIYGLLIDAAWLWEEYLNTILKKLDFIHPENKTGKHRIQLFNNSQSLYPDFYHIEKSIVIDAKYKKLQDEGKLNREDIYQVVTYMYRLQSKYGVLLYPANANSFETFDMHKESYGGGEALFVKYGMKIPIEISDYKEYTDGFRDSEEKLSTHFAKKSIQIDVLTE